MPETSQKRKERGEKLGSVCARKDSGEKRPHKAKGEQNHDQNGENSFHEAEGYQKMRALYIH